MDRLPELAVELVGLNVDVIITVERSHPLPSSGLRRPFLSS
jgi:hypothetical protein